jgi:autotransporter-associated beta strand protein
VHALNGTWDKTKSGNWSDSANWLDGVIANGAGYRASGQALSSGPRTITLDTPRTIGSLYLDCNGTGRTYVFSDPTGANPLTFSGGGTPHEVIALNGQLELRVELAGTGGVRFFGVNAGGNPMTYLYATNTYTGDTEIAGEGTLRIGVGVVDAIPHGPGKGNVVLLFAHNDYSTLDIRESDITINGLSGSGGTVTASVSINTGTSTLTVGDADATATFSGIIQDGSRVVALTKIGTGTQTLAGFCTNSGPTTVNGGTLAVNGLMSSDVTVNNTGTLGGTGTVNGAVTVTAGGKIGPGSSAGILSLGNGLDMSAPNTTYVWELAANSASNPGTDFDQIALTGGSADVSDANLNIQFIGTATAPDGAGFWASDHSWLVISGTTTGNFKTVQNGTNAAGFFYTTVDGGGVTLNFKAGVVVPTQNPKITSITGAGTASVTVNYNNCVVGKTYFLQWKSPITGSWTTIGSGQLATATSEFQTDNTATGSQRYYRVYYVP